MYRQSPFAKPSIWANFRNSICIKKTDKPMFRSREFVADQKFYRVPALKTPGYQDGSSIQFPPVDLTSIKVKFEVQNEPEESSG